MTTKLTQAQIEALLDDIDDLGYEDKIEAIAQWFRKVRHEYALTAAAEVGEVKTCSPAHRERNEIIERCAQVVENFDLSLEYRVRDTIKAIAAAIRALKNEPLSCPPSPRIEG